MGAEKADEEVVMLGDVGLHNYGGLLGPIRIGYMPDAYYGPGGLQNASWFSQGERSLMATQWEMAEARDREWAYWRAEMRRARPIIAQWSEWEQQTRAEAWR